MKIFEYEITFTAPAFLGNAEQSGQWRTPPFKTLLRQWWRVAYSAGESLDQTFVNRMRDAEGQLFGVAADKAKGSRKSQIRIRLNRWDCGALKSWPGLDFGSVSHPEVGKNVDAQLYLGYGPLVFQNGGTALKKSAAIRAGETAGVRLAVPDEQEGVLTTAFLLMDRFGTLGGRSRNGWGSFSLVPQNDTPAHSRILDSGLLRGWEEALNNDWPHCIGSSDRGPLIWETGQMADWKAAMKRLAEIKIGLRTQFKFPDAQPPHPAPLARHWLAYPITKHATNAWDRNARLPNSLRFKVRQDADGALHGVIFHVPCRPPIQFNPDIEAITEVWLRVHSYLDAPQQQLRRIST